MSKLVITLNGVSLRPVELDDDALILTLRSTPNSRRLLSAGAETVKSQRLWITNYLERRAKELEYYFIIMNDALPVGAVRIYQVDRSSGGFNWGSWVMMEGINPVVAWSSVILVYDFAFDRLGLTAANFEVLASNSNVVRFHHGFGAQMTGERNGFIYFTLGRSKYAEFRGKFLNRIQSVSGQNSRGASSL